jgi:hypothetical protein
MTTLTHCIFSFTGSCGSRDTLSEGTTGQDSNNPQGQQLFFHWL